MNSRNILICIILGLIIIGLVVFLFVVDATDKTVLSVGDVNYDISDFESYVKVFNYEEDSSKDDLDTMFTNYQSYKVYATRAEKAGVELDSGEMPAQLESGDAEKLMNDFGLTAEEYMRVKTEMAKANKLYASPYELAKISKSYFSDYKKSLLDVDSSAFDTYDYRVVEIKKEQDELIENESGEMVPAVTVSGETSGERAERFSKEAREKTDKVLGLVKAFVEASGDKTTQVTLIERLTEFIPQKESGDTLPEDIFEYIGSNTDNTRYTQNTNGFSSVANGGLDSASKLYMEEDMTGQSSYLAMFGMSDLASKIVDNVNKLKEGEFSEIFETDSGYAFVYLEKVRNELSETDETRFNNEIANAYIGQNAQIRVNKTMVKSIDLNTLIPKNARVEVSNSGETIATDIQSSENVSVENTNDAGVVEEQTPQETTDTTSENN